MTFPFSIARSWVLSLVLGLHCVANAEPGRQGAVFTVIEENDLVVDTDRHYTQGIKLSYLHEDGYLPLGSGWLNDALPKPGLVPEAAKFGYSIGQNIYTPGNINTQQLLANDRPYAGWLYLGFILQRRGKSFGDHPTLEDIELELGVVGPASLADRAQTWVHEIRGSGKPLGWEHQLKNEPGLRLK